MLFDIIINNQKGKYGAGDMKNNQVGEDRYNGFISLYEKNRYEIQQKYKDTNENFYTILEKIKKYMKDEEYYWAWDLSVDLSYMTDGTYQQEWELYLIAFELYLNDEGDLVDMIFSYDKAIEKAPLDVAKKYKKADRENWDRIIANNKKKDWRM